MPMIANHDAWFANLQALADDRFPKRCRSCGREYASEADYFQQTQAIRPDITGLKAVDDDEGPLVEVFRNCVCGSTLLVNCASRRDHSAYGDRQRLLFDDLLVYLVRHGVERALARRELRRVAGGERSEMLEAWYAQIAVQSKQPKR